MARAEGDPVPQLAGHGSGELGDPAWPCLYDHRLLATVQTLLERRAIPLGEVHHPASSATCRPASR